MWSATLKTLIDGQVMNPNPEQPQRERTEWHNVSVFDQNAAQYAQNYLRKVNKVCKPTPRAV